MSQPNTVESWLQFNLQLLIDDNESPVGFMSGRVDGMPDRTPQRWQLAVDMIYRCIVSGLIQIATPQYRDDRDAFFHVLRTFDPYVDDDGILLWHGGQLSPTEALIAMVGKYFPTTGHYERTVNPAFIQELKDIFAAHGVPWSDAPLLPIVTGEDSARA
ncbi:MAG: hypothetical protein E7774_15745 [Bradyrhizobium sp.]|nr:MAG: hypothetical protein E7774_15745 [Bradyrhizobium sp.]